ncbi:unnamed protein product [Amaranthus hypochondriacus]
MAEIEAQVYPVEDVNADDEELKKDSRAEATIGNVTAPLSENTVSLKTKITNLTPKLVIRLDSHFWVGWSANSRPTLSPGYYTIITQKGELPAGVKWGICYADGEDTTARKWVVAFDTAAQKAYAEAGPTGPVDWNVVEVKLGFAGNKSEVVDPILGGKCTAEINDLKAYATFR